MLERTRPDVLLACPIIEAHGGGGARGARGRLPRACREAVRDRRSRRRASSTELAEAKGLHARASSRTGARARPARALKRAVDEGRLGEVSHVFFRYLRDREKPHLPDYLFEEADPMLWAMGIHHLDLFRYVLGQEIVRVEGSARPAQLEPLPRPVDRPTLDWRPTAASLISYVATFSSRNAHIPQESLQVEGELGTVYNDSDYFEPPLLLSLRDAEQVGRPDRRRARPPSASTRPQYDIADTGGPGELPRRRARGTPADRLRRATTSGRSQLLAAARNALRVSTVG